MSIPFAGEEFTFTQPDGTALRVRGWGNQHHAVFETLNGYTIVQDPVSGFFQYATLSSDADDLRPSGAQPRMVKPQMLGIQPGLRISRQAAKAKVLESHLPPGSSRWEVRRKQYKESVRSALAAPGIAPAPPQRETVGDFVGLCLLVQFPDLPGTITRQQVDDFCNKQGYSEFGNQGSVYDYFYDVSGSKLRYKSVVTPYYTAQHNRSYYTDETVAQPIRARELIKEALDYFRLQGFDFSTLTTDDQDYVYATNVFYAGTRDNNWAKGLWPHSFHLLTPYPLAAGKNAFDYQITDMTSQLTLGTFCHENGHMICDFPDLYDYASDGMKSSGIGRYCLMCAGGNVSPKNPTDINAYLKYRAGWGSVMPITPNLHATLVAGQNKFLIHRKGQTEYFIVEVRHRAGRDASLPSSGLAVWHIDELGNNENQQMTSALHYECSLIQADGKFDLEQGNGQGDVQDFFGAGVNTHFGSTTNPNSLWWDGSPSGLDLSAISVGAASMTVNCNV